MQVVPLIPSLHSPCRLGIGKMVVSRPLCAVWVIFLILLLGLLHRNQAEKDIMFKGILSWWSQSHQQGQAQE